MTSSGLQTTNLGQQAQTTRLLANSISANNYQQPFLATGSLLAPLISGIIGVNYIAGVNKYIVYCQAPASTIGINQTLILNNPVLPANFPDLFTTTCSTEWVLTGPTAAGPPTLPVIITTVSCINDTLPPSLGTSYVFEAISFTPATYPVGNNAVLKMVININLD